MEEHLFPKQAAPPGAPLSGPALSAQVTSIATRLKLAEERYANLQKRDQITEESLLSFEREMKAEMRATLQQAVELRRRVQEISQKVDAISGEVPRLVQRHEFAVVERYLDLWQPLRFVTRDEAKRMILDALRESRSVPVTIPEVTPHA